MTTLIRSSDSPPSELVGRQTPRIGTARRLDVPTRGRQIAALMQLVGVTLDEWQILAIDTALELDPTGIYAYRTIVLIVGRQNGKTVVDLARILGGLFVLDDRLILHTAQDRAVPRELFESLVEYIGDTPALHRRVAKRGIRETNGQERIRLLDGSTYRIIAPRPKAFRSWSADCLIFDEAREQRDLDLWGAAIPTMSVRPNPQVWVTSNAGDVDSVVLNRLRDRGRIAALDPARDPRLCYLEWSAPGGPEGPLDDRESWTYANPALGGRLTEETIVAELADLDESKFRTERLCQWVERRTVSAIPMEKWVACGGTPPAVEPGLPRPVMGVHVNGDRTHGALALVAERDGRLIADVVEEWRDDDGIDLLEMADSTLAWMKAHKVRQIAYDRAAASAIARRVERKRYEAHRIDTVEYVIASQNLSDAIDTGYLFHRNNPSLDVQIAAAGRKTRTDETWFISQAESAGSITAVLALAFAVNVAYRPVRSSSVRGSKPPDPSEPPAS